MTNTRFNINLLIKVLHSNTESYPGERWLRYRYDRGHH